MMIKIYFYHWNRIRKTLNVLWDVRWIGKSYQIERRVVYWFTIRLILIIRHSGKSNLSGLLI